MKGQRPQPPLKSLRTSPALDPPLHNVPDCWCGHRDDSQPNLLLLILLS